MRKKRERERESFSSEFSFILENVPTTAEIVVSTRIFYGNERKYNKTKDGIK